MEINKNNLVITWQEANRTYVIEQIDPSTGERSILAKRNTWLKIIHTLTDPEFSSQRDRCRTGMIDAGEWLRD